MSTYTPYPQPEPPTPPSPEPRRSGATKPIMIIVAVIGGIALLAITLTTVLGSLTGLNRGASTTTASTNGVTAINIDANASQFTVEFADVPEATLQTSGINHDGWQLRRDGNELRVSAPYQWFNWCFFGCNFDENQVTLTLPEELNDGNLNADLDLSAGRLEADGQFNRLEVKVGAGEANVNGAANEVDAQVSAGGANLNLADVQIAEFDVSAGRLIAELTGAAPTTVNAEVSAGQLDVTLPDTQYAVQSDVSAGDLTNQLQTSSASNHKVTIDVSAGDATLRPGETVQQ